MNATRSEPTNLTYGGDTYEYYYYYYSTETDYACSVLGIPEEICKDPLLVTVSLGYIYPFIAIVTSVANLFSFLVFTRFSRSATCVFLAGIAVADTVTALSPTVHLIHLYGMGNFAELMSFKWCSTYFIATELVPLTFHTVSIFLTMSLCVQRFICVCRPFSARICYSIPKSVLCVMTAYTLGIIVHCHKLFYIDNKIIHFNVSSVDDPFSFRDASCCWWNIELGHVHSTSHRIIYILLIQALPCGVVTVLTIKIIRQLKKSYHLRKVMTSEEAEVEQLQIETRQTTVMLVVIMTLFLVTEIPLGISLLLITAKQFLENVISHYTLYIMVMTQTLVVLVNCHLNFWIYCTMSKKFRLSLWYMLSCRIDEIGELSRSSMKIK